MGEASFCGCVLYTERPEGVKRRWFAVDLYEQILVAYEEDTPVFATLIASGRRVWSTSSSSESRSINENPAYPDRETVPHLAPNQGP